MADDVRAQAPLRRYDLDWLRVLLFALLVLHHAAVGFADFGADTYGFANDRLGGDLWSLWIYFNHTWRLPALFLIAGIGTWFATSRGIGARFLASRLGRLLLPTIFGAFVLNMAAGFAIARVTGEYSGLADFIRGWWLSPEPHQVMHLWFLVNLAIYTLLTWPLFLARDRLARMRVAPQRLLLGLAVSVTLVAVLLKPYGAALTGEGYQFPWYWGIFAAGYVIGAQHRPILDWTARWWWALLLAGLLGFAVEVGVLAVYSESDPLFGTYLSSGGWAASGVLPAYAVSTVIYTFAEGANAWLFSLTAVGLCARYLNRPSPGLRALTRATFPIYVLHFPLTIVGLALLTLIDWGWGLEFMLLVLGVYVGTALLYLAALRAGPAIALIGGRREAISQISKVAPRADSV
ncbi:MAG: acyltransferase family protein [Pseudomonadota bacterium]